MLEYNRLEPSDWQASQACPPSLQAFLAPPPLQLWAWLLILHRPHPLQDKQTLRTSSTLSKVD